MENYGENDLPAFKSWRVSIAKEANKEDAAAWQPLWVFLMAAAINAAACWGDVTEIPVCERMCVCRRGFLCLVVPSLRGDGSHFMGLFILLL